MVFIWANTFAYISVYWHTSLTQVTPYTWMKSCFFLPFLPPRVPVGVGFHSTFIFPLIDLSISLSMLVRVVLFILLGVKTNCNEKTAAQNMYLYIHEPSCQQSPHNKVMLDMSWLLNRGVFTFTLNTDKHGCEQSRCKDQKGEKSYVFRSSASCFIFLKIQSEIHYLNYWMKKLHCPNINTNQLQM